MNIIDKISFCMKKIFHLPLNANEISYILDETQLSAESLNIRYCYELLPYLKKKQIPEDVYSISRVKDETICIIRENNVWSIFYSERGQRINAANFMNEQSACKHFLLEVKKIIGLDIYINSLYDKL